MFSHEYSKIFKETYFEEHLWTAASVSCLVDLCIIFCLHCSNINNSLNFYKVFQWHIFSTYNHIWWWWWWWWWWIVFVVSLTDERHLALYPAGTTVRDPHHHESLMCSEQGLSLCRTWVQALLNEVMQ